MTHLDVRTDVRTGARSRSVRSCGLRYPKPTAFSGDEMENSKGREEEHIGYDVAFYGGTIFMSLSSASYCV